MCDTYGVPVEVRFEDPPLFFMRAHGIVTVDEVRGAVDALVSDGRLQAGVPLLIDNREVTSDRTVGEVAAITTAFRALFAKGVTRVAVVTDRELEPSQIFAGFASTVGANVKVFRSDDDARRWLYEHSG